VDLLLEATFRAERDHFWFRGFRRFIEPFVAEAAKGLSDPAILDCGCGTGANLELLARYGRPFAFDLTESGLLYARRGRHRRLARASILHIPFAAASADIVTSFDVLQCLAPTGIARALGELHRVLRPGGRLVLNVAALEALRGNHSVLSEEVTRFNRRRFAEAVRGAGFDVRRITFTNASLFPMLLALRTAQRAAGLVSAEEAGREISVPPAVVNEPLAAVLGAEARLLRYVNLPIGSSLLCLAEKPVPRTGQA
jgi:SAM-dependent methyltransferase